MTAIELEPACPQAVRSTAIELEPACPEAVRSTVYDRRDRRVGTPAPGLTVSPHRTVTGIAAFALVALVLLSTASLAGDEHHEAQLHDDHQHEQPHDEHAPATFSVQDFEKAGVRLASAAPGAIDIAIELPGEVRPNADRIAHLSPRFSGLVREVRRHIGDTVRAGEVLAIIESENLSPFELKTAFAGTIIDKHITAGEFVGRDEAAFIVADLSTVWANISVYQSALVDVQVGQAVTVTAGHGALEATGTIGYIAPVVDQATRTASARVVLPNPNGAWRPGLFVTAIVHKPHEAAIAIPRRAVHTVDGTTAVFVAAGERFIVRPVDIGRTGRTRVEIVGGLAPGERFADDRSFLVKAELGKGESGHDH